MTTLLLCAFALHAGLVKSLRSPDDFTLQEVLARRDLDDLSYKNGPTLKYEGWGTRKTIIASRLGHG
jgi:hypothetical protein